VTHNSAFFWPYELQDANFGLALWLQSISEHTFNSTFSSICDYSFTTLSAAQTLRRSMTISDNGMKKIRQEAVPYAGR
jgi:hypothetical protein